MKKSILLAVMFVPFLMIGYTGTVLADSFFFFGEDNKKFGRTNADAAYEAFASQLAAGVLTEDFEDITLDKKAPLNLDFGSAGVAQLTGTGFVDNREKHDRWATSGDKYWEAQSADFSINFDEENDVAAFGFYGTDIGDIKGTLKLSLTYRDDSVDNFDVSNTIGAVSGSGLFWGYINEDKYFKSLSFSTTEEGDHFGFDDMTVATRSDVNPVPEPTTMMLFGVGLTALAGMKTKKRKNRLKG